MQQRICSIFGHRDCPRNLAETIKKSALLLIENEGITAFYVGHNGVFDSLCLSALRDIQKENPQIQVLQILAYYDPLHPPAPGGPATLFPEALCQVSKRYAISRRNRWMVDQSAHVLSYVSHRGGAYDMAAYAIKKGVPVTNLGNAKLP